MYDITLHLPMFNFNNHLLDQSLQDCVDLQEDITRLQNWSDTWLLQFHPEKCKVMQVGHNSRFQCHIKQSNHTYILKETEEEKNLGILVSNNLDTSEQCAEAAKKR